MVPENAIYKEALLAARGHSTDFLQERADALAFDVSDEDPDWPGPVGRHLAMERLRAVRAVLDHRERLARTTAGLPSPMDRRYAAWTELARLVRERIELPAVFVMAGYPIRLAGHNARRGVAEWCGPCPVCGGDDRLRVWAGPNGRAWCRQCPWSGDAITVAMSLQQAGFRDAVRWLADIAGERAVPA